LGEHPLPVGVLLLRRLLLRAQQHPGELGPNTSLPNAIT
jgi:hypothetical protein